MPQLLAALLSAQTILFLIFALGALATAIVMVLNPNPIRSALFLVLNLFCVAVLYLLLNAYFLAAVQVIVYAGAILVLFLFVIMLLNLGTPDRAEDRLRWQQPVAVGAGLLLAAVVGYAIATATPTPQLDANGAVIPTRVRVRPRVISAQGVEITPGAATATASAATDSKGATGSDATASGDEAVPAKPAPLTPNQYGTPEGIGQTLYDPAQPWLFPFEITSILLLIAVIGSVVLAKRGAGEPERGGI